MTNHLENEIRAVLAQMDEQENQQQEANPQTSPDEIQDMYLLIVREQEEEDDQPQVVDRVPAPVPPQQETFLSAYMFVCFSLFLIFSTLALQLSCIVNPPLATVTIIPKSQTVTLNGIVQLGRVLPPLTISQSQSTPATGTGHLIAKAATGTSHSIMVNFKA